jgi:hypothetical protein
MKIVEILPKEGLKLFLRYEDGIAGVVDLSSLAGKGVFASWLVPGTFEKVGLSDSGAPEWPGEIDLCPDALYLDLTGKKAEEVFPTLRTISTHA